MEIEACLGWISFSTNIYCHKLEVSFEHIPWILPRVTENALASGVTDGGQGGKPPPGKLNTKTGPLSADILGFSILSSFIRLLFFCVFGVCSFF